MVLIGHRSPLTDCVRPFGRRNACSLYIVPTEKTFCLGGISGRVTPVPIPNTVVKPAGADGSQGGESR